MASRFKYDRHSIRSLIARLAQDSNNVFIVNECGKGDWEATVNHLQIVQCLADGMVMTDPVSNEKTECWECVMERYNAGQLIRVEVAVSYDGGEIIAINACASDAEWDD